MVIRIKRTSYLSDRTLGVVTVDGTKFGYSLEDLVRTDGSKVAGKTAIPAGTYRVEWNRSNRFSKIAGKDVFMPLLMDVPGFAGVRIHSGNGPADTEGCLLIGFDLDSRTKEITRSRDAIKALYAQIQSAKHGVTIEIS